MSPVNDPAESRSSRQLRVCLAEDYSDLRQTLKQMLVGLGHNVICAVENGQQLLDAIRDQPVDLVIMDLDMPVLDGLATADLMSVDRRTPVILISGHSDLQHVVAEKEPVSICLRKPITLDQLKAAIEQATAAART